MVSALGWRGEAHKAMRRLAERMSKTKELSGLVGESFVLDLIFEWLCQTLEAQETDSISDFVCRRAEAEITDHHLYIPLCRTYSSLDFSIGDVEFRS
jgi:hypothetical protein